MKKKTGVAVNKADEIKNAAKALEETVLSLLSTIKELSKLYKGPSKIQKRALSILKGPFFGKSTKRQLRDLNDRFSDLEEKLKDTYRFYRGFSAQDRFEYPNPYDFQICESLWKQWAADSKQATVFKNNLLRKLSPDSDGKLYNEIREGSWPTKEIDDLKINAISFLAIIGEFKKS